MAYSPSQQSSRETRTGVLVLGILATLFVAVATYRYFQATRTQENATAAAPAQTQSGSPVATASKQREVTPRPMQVEPEQPRRLPPMEDHAGQMPAYIEPQAATDVSPAGSRKPAVQRTSHTQPLHSYPPAADLPTEKLQPAPQPVTQRIVAGQDDSFWTIAARVYGAGSYYKALYAYNRSQFPQPDRLQAGAVIIAPPKETLYELFPADCPSAGKLKPASEPAPALANVQRVSHEETTIQRLYTVQPGEDLFGIATRELGAGYRWTEIYRLNADILHGAIERVPAGLRLRMPPR